MVYVGTPKSYGDNVTTLASILAGESSTLEGQLAVANVMQNRANVNFGGYGTDIMSQALAPNQFQGQVGINSIPDSAYGVAGGALSGNNPNILPDSLNYAAPGSTAPWAVNALNNGQGITIGGNTFFANDKGGTPAFDVNAWNGAQTWGAFPTGQDTGLPNTTPGGAAYGPDQSGEYIEYAPDQSPGTDIGLPSGTEGFGQAGQGVSGAPVGIPDTPNQGSGAFGSNPLTQMGIGGASGDQSTPFGTGPTPGGSDQSAGAPVDITDISAAGGKGAGPQIQSGLNQAGQDVGKAGQALDQTLTSNTQSAESTGTGWFQYIGNLLFNLLPRFSVGVLAIVLIGLGIWLMGIEQRRSA